ncbi:MAG: ABC1 kinase family protein [Myxococcaceae bacterium]
MSDEDDSLPSGRFARFRKLASLSASLAADAAGKSVKRLTGSDPLELSKGTAEKLVAALGEMKGMAMKLGQAVSMDPEAFPPEARAVLARLQNAAPPMSYEKVERVVGEELGASPQSVFASFEKTPLAAASLGQVHRAVTKDGREVVVKVQYPEIAKGLRSDLDNLAMLVKTMGSTPVFDIRKHFEDVRNEFLSELDYRREAELARAFKTELSQWRDLTAPEPLESLSAGRVLTLEYLRGPTLKEFIHNGASNDDRFRVSTQLTNVLFGPFLKSGVMHVDPHPGNYLVMEGGTLGVLDFGAVKRFSEDFIDVNRQMFRKAVLDDRSVDPAALSHRIGFEIGIPDEEIRSLVDATYAIVCRPLREPTWDYAKDDTQQKVREFARSKLTRFMKFKPPVEMPLFLRAVGGTYQNHRVLAAHGPFRDAYVELLKLC